MSRQWACVGVGSVAVRTVVGLHALVAHQGDFDALEDGVPVVVLHLHLCIKVKVSAEIMHAKMVRVVAKHHF